MNLNWSYSPETVKLGVDLCDLDLWPLTLTFCMDVTFVIGNNSWKFHDDTMMGTWWKRCHGRTDRQTDRQTDWQTDGQNQSYSCLVAAKNCISIDLRIDIESILGRNYSPLGCLHLALAYKYYFVWRKHENMSQCTGSRVSTNHKKKPAEN